MCGLLAGLSPLMGVGLLSCPGALRFRAEGQVVQGVYPSSQTRWPFPPRPDEFDSLIQEK